MMEDSEKPSELPGNPLDHSSDHATNHSAGDKDSGTTTHQHNSVEIGPPGETAHVEGEKTKNGGYGYYVVGEQGN
jgi:hypothetical protein